MFSRALSVLSSAYPGTSFGTFIYATSQNELIVIYGLDGCLLIIGAVSLNLMACAGFMRPLKMPGYYLKQKAALERSTEEQLFEKQALEDLKVCTGSNTTTPEKSHVTKELLMAADAKDLVQVEAGKGSFLAPVMEAVKRKQQAYSKYTQSTYEILQDQAMVACCIAVFLFSLGAFPPVLFIEDVAQSQGLIEEVSVIPLVSIGAIATCVGKLVLGVLVDISWINGIYLYAFTMFAGGAALLIIPIIKSYLGLQILSAILGFFSGNWSLTSYITTKIVGLDRLTQAHGVLMFFGGIGIMLGPPVVGKSFPSPPWWSEGAGWVDLPACSACFFPPQDGSLTGRSRTTWRFTSVEAACFWERSSSPCSPSPAGTGSPGTARGQTSGTPAAVTKWPLWPDAKLPEEPLLQLQTPFFSKSFRNC